MSETQIIQFRKDIIHIVNILNKIFNPIALDSNTVPANFINIDNQIPESLVPGLQYKMNDNELKQTLFEKICQNIALIYTKPITNQTLRFNKKSDFIPLSLSDQTYKDNVGYLGIQAGNLKEYNIRNDGTVESKDIKDVQQKGICQSDDPSLLRLQNYFYLKLKLMVYVRSVLNLYPNEALNRYEIILKEQEKKSGGMRSAMISKAKLNFEKWYNQIETLFKQLKNDDIIAPNQLQNFVDLFEKQDPTTQNLCESIAELCGSNPKQVCVDINIHSVTENIICNNSTKEIGTELPVLPASNIPQNEPPVPTSLPAPVPFPVPPGGGTTSTFDPLSGIDSPISNIPTRPRSTPTPIPVPLVAPVPSKGDVTKTTSFDSPISKLTQPQNIPAPVPAPVPVPSKGGVSKTTSFDSPISKLTQPQNIPAPVPVPVPAPVPAPVPTSSGVETISRNPSSKNLPKLLNVASVPESNVPVEKKFVCLGQSTLTQEIEDLIENSNNENDKKILKDIQFLLNNYVQKRLKKIFN